MNAAAVAAAAAAAAANDDEILPMDPICGPIAPSNVGGRLTTLRLEVGDLRVVYA